MCFVQAKLRATWVKAGCNIVIIILLLWPVLEHIQQPISVREILDTYWEKSTLLKIHIIYILFLNSGFLRLSLYRLRPRQHFQNVFDAFVIASTLNERKHWSFTSKKNIRSKRLSRVETASENGALLWYYCGRRKWRHWKRH